MNQDTSHKRSITEVRASRRRKVDPPPILEEEARPPQGREMGVQSEAVSIEGDAGEVVAGATEPVEAGGREIPEAVAPVSAAEAMTLALTPSQQTAIQLLTSGHSSMEAAQAAGVNRSTLYRWLNGDPAFVAAFNAWRQDVVDTARGRLLALSELAVTTVAKALVQGDAATAMKILKSVGALEQGKPGSTDPKAVLRLQKLEKQKSDTALRKAEGRAELESWEPL